MSTFYATLSGEKKPKAKQGQRRIEAHVRGWDHGIRVNYWLDENDEAHCTIYQTGGSNHPDDGKLVKRFNLGKVSKRRPGSDRYGSPVGGF